MSEYHGAISINHAACSILGVFNFKYIHIDIIDINIEPYIWCLFIGKCLYVYIAVSNLWNFLFTCEIKQLISMQRFFKSYQASKTVTVSYSGRHRQLWHTRLYKIRRPKWWLLGLSSVSITVKGRQRQGKINSEKWKVDWGFQNLLQKDFFVWDIT
jgi:hypothetical protein